MGNKMDRGKMSDGTIAFVGRTANNNGINARVGRVIDHEKYGTVEPYEKGCITLALGGSIGSCFIQELLVSIILTTAYLDINASIIRRHLTVVQSSIKKFLTKLLGINTFLETDIVHSSFLEIFF